MNTFNLPLDCDKPSLTDCVESYFLNHPVEWVSMQTLAQIGGTGGWRTRVSDCRLKRGMKIENRQNRQNGFTISEYRYIPS